MNRRRSILLLSGFLAVGDSFGQGNSGKLAPAHENFLIAVDGLIKAHRWPRTKTEKDLFQIGVESGNANEFSLKPLSGRKMPDGRESQVSGINPRIEAADLKRMEVIVLQSPTSVQTYLKRTEFGNTVILGTFKGALEAGCHVGLHQSDHGHYHFEVNLAALKKLRVECSSDFLRHKVERIVRKEGELK